MAWSTRELAELAGTTVNAVRHYHRAGLLDEPARRGNGYKQYDARDLARLLQIRRLRDLGVPLADIGRLDLPGDDADAVLEAVDAELAAGIERLQKARDDLATVIRDRGPLDVPAVFGSVARRLGPSDRALVAIYAQFFDPASMDEVRRMVEVEPVDIARDFDELSPSADDAQREELAGRIAPLLAQHRVDYPEVSTRPLRGDVRREVVDDTLRTVLSQLYHDAQRDVLARAIRLSHQAQDGAGTGPAQTSGG